MVENKNDDVESGDKKVNLDKGLLSPKVFVLKLPMEKTV